MFNKKEYNKKWAQKHRLELEQDPQRLEKQRKYMREYIKRWRKNNPEKEKKFNRKAHAKRYKEDKILCQIWKKNNPQKIKIYRRRRYIKQKSNPKYRINDSIRTLIRQALKGKKAGRHWETLVGYTLDDLIRHLEKQFDENMSWDNYGKYEEGKFKWHIDHKRPISLFHYETPEDEEFKKCWALKNLQPLEAIANIRKSNHF